MSHRTGLQPDAGESFCKCGRSTTSPHCPRCGSSNVQAVRRAGRYVMVNNLREFIRGFRCRRCDQDFQEDWPCAAPKKLVGSIPRSATDLDRAVAKIPNSKERLDKAREALASLFKSRGIPVPSDGPVPTEAEPTNDVVLAEQTPEPTAPQAEPMADEVNSSDEARKRGEFKDHFFGK